METVITKTNANGAVKTPGATSAAPKVIVPSGPVSGRTGDKVLTEAISTVFLPAEPRETAGGQPGNPGPGAGANDDVQAITDKILSSQGQQEEESGNRESGKAETTELPTEPTELAELTARAEANGVTPEEQHGAEVAELKRLTDKATAEGKTIEQILAEEEAGADESGKRESEKAKTFSQAQVEELIQKRVGNLKAENERLAAELAEARNRPEARGAGPEAGGLDTITDAAGLQRIKTQATEGVRQADRLLALLPVAPGKVEAELKRMIPAEQQAGLEFSPESMAEILLNSKDAFAKQLEAVPARENWLAEHAKAEELTPKVIPWIRDAADPRTQLFNRFAGQMPGLKQSPAWKYWLGLAVEGHFAKLAAAQKPSARRGAEGAEGAKPKFIPKVRFPASGKAAGGGRAAGPTDAAARAKAELKATGSEQALENFLKVRFGAV